MFFKLNFHNFKLLIYLDEEIAKKTTCKPEPVAVKSESTSCKVPIENDLKKKQEIFQANSSSYNGAIRDNYSWSQSIKDIDIRVKV